MTTYPIHPGERLQRRIVSVLTTDLLGLSAFTGFTITNERTAVEVALPVLAVRVTESQEQPPRSNVWHCQVTVQMIEDRQEASTVIGADTRPRHELRAENLSSRLFGKWGGLSLADSINAISNGQGVYALKTFGGVTTSGQGEQDTIGAEYNFTTICVSTQQ